MEASRAPRDNVDAEDGAIINSTEPGMVLGTPNYMSPEQVRGASLPACLITLERM